MRCTSSAARITDVAQASRNFHALAPSSRIVINTSHLSSRSVKASTSSRASNVRFYDRAASWLGYPPTPLLNCCICSVVT